MILENTWIKNEMKRKYNIVNEEKNNYFTIIFQKSNFIFRNNE